LTEYLMQRLAGVNSYSEFLETPLQINPDDLVPAEERARWLALPSTIVIAERVYPLDYAFEDGQAVVRARIPAKALTYADEDELPVFDRPLHWTVTRGKHEAIRATSLDEARVLVRDTSPATRARARDAEDGDRPRGGGGGRRGGGGGRDEGGRGPRRSGQRKGARGGRGGKGGPKGRRRARH
jgi:hypothetical protein